MRTGAAWLGKRVLHGVEFMADQVWNQANTFMDKVLLVCQHPNFMPRLAQECKRFLGKHQFFPCDRMHCFSFV
jgi:hypothetical protein